MSSSSSIIKRSHVDQAALTTASRRPPPLFTTDIITDAVQSILQFSEVRDCFHLVRTNAQLYGRWKLPTFRATVLKSFGSGHLLSFLYYKICIHKTITPGNFNRVFVYFLEFVKYFNASDENSLLPFVTTQLDRTDVQNWLRGLKELHLSSSGINGNQLMDWIRRCSDKLIVLTIHNTNRSNFLLSPIAANLESDSFVQSSVKNLIKLGLIGFHLTWPQFRSFISKCPNVYLLDIQVQNENFMSALVKGLKTDQNVKKWFAKLRGVVLMDNNLTSEELVNLLIACSSLEHLDISDQNPSDGERPLHFVTRLLGPSVSDGETTPVVCELYNRLCNLEMLILDRLVVTRDDLSTIMWCCNDLDKLSLEGCPVESVMDWITELKSKQNKPFYETVRGNLKTLKHVSLPEDLADSYIVDFLKFCSENVKVTPIPDGDWMTDGYSADNPQTYSEYLNQCPSS